ncbi:TonB-dependent siderophore receptor [Duganella levis]|uniref:TonB-dependent siderophore receptor n=1 Tax=Duganella levis TaxID=2692169 RepID=A0ABW9W2Q8_9BURK|nr:TonB-dependent siderophore receptor [Duganella levis]MYN28282.1 TonB-dependent siderophore receptor [Duganella levis]
MHPSHPARRLTPLALAIHIACGVALQASGVAALAQTTAPARQYDIPAGALGTALNQFALQAGVSIVVEPAKVQGLRTQGLKGSYRVSEGFERLLRGTGYAIAATDAGYVLVAAAQDAPQVLPTITATGATDGPSENSGLYSMPSMSTATRLGLSVRETPQSVSVVTRQEIDDLALTTVPDILEKTVGVTVGRNDSERATFYARGYVIENFQFDGMPNTLDSSNQYTSAIYDRVEIVKGAGGLLTGAGNPSATINLVRKRPGKEFAASLAGSIGSWSKYHGTADVSSPLNADGSVRGRVVVAAQNADSYIDYYSRDTRNAYAIVEADLGPRTLLSAGVDHMETRANGATFGHLPLFYSDGTQTHFRRSLNPGARWSYWNNDSTNSFATLKHTFDNAWQLDVTASHLDQSKDVMYGSAYNGSVDRVTGAGIRALAGLLPSEAKTDSVNLALTGPFSLLGRTHELMLTAGYSRQHKQAELFGSTFLPVPNYFTWDGYLDQPAFTKRADRDTTIIEKGVSVATRLRPTDELSLIIGTRASQYKLLDYDVDTSGARSVSDDLNTGTKTIPYAGVVYDLNTNWSAYASYTDIFNPQTYYRDAAGRPLAPLTGKSAELGVKAELLDKRLNLSMAVFRIKQKNAAQYVDVNPDTFEEIYKPVDGITSDGFEAEVSGQITPSWNVAGGYTYRRSRVPAQPDVILSAVNTNQPKHLFKMNTSYRMHRLVVGGSLSVQSETYYQTSDERLWRANQPGYALLGLMARYEIDPHLSVSLNINNVFDKTYMPGLGSYGTGVYGDPRNALLTLKYQF